MAASSLVTGVIVARWLGAEGLGVLAVVNVAVAITLQLISLGLPSANTYLIAQDDVRFLRPVTTISLAFAIVVGSLFSAGLTLMASIRPELFGHISPKLIAIASIALPFQFITLLGLNIFLALGSIARYNSLEVAGQVVLLLNAVTVLILLGLGLPELISLNSAAAAFVSISVLYLLLRRVKRQSRSTRVRPSFQLFKTLMAYGLKFHIATLAGLLIFRLDLLVLNHFRGGSEAGVYSVASQVAMMIMLLPGAIASLLFPRVAAEQTERRDELTCRATRATLALMLVACLAAAPASFVFPLVYGSSFADSTTQFLILLPGVFLISIESVVVQYFTASGLPRAIPLFWLITLVVNLGLTFALVPRHGGLGAAVASTISYALIFLLVLFYFRRRTGNELSRILILSKGDLRGVFRSSSET